MATHCPAHQLRLASIWMTLPVMLAGSACTSPTRFGVTYSLQTGRSWSSIASALAPRGGAGFSASSAATTAVVSRQRTAKRIGFFTREQTGGTGERFHRLRWANAEGECRVQNAECRMGDRLIL